MRSSVSCVRSSESWTSRVFRRKIQRAVPDVGQPVRRTQKRRRLGSESSTDRLVSSIPCTTSNYGRQHTSFTSVAELDDKRVGWHIPERAKGVVKNCRTTSAMPIACGTERATPMVLKPTASPPRLPRWPCVSIGGPKKLTRRHPACARTCSHEFGNTMGVGVNPTIKKASVSQPRTIRPVPSGT